MDYKIYFYLYRNMKEDIQRLQHEKDELSLKNENIHDEMTPRYLFPFTSIISYPFFLLVHRGKWLVK